MGEDRSSETIQERLERGRWEEGTPGTCGTCGNDKGIHRMDGGLPAGCHCDACWEKMVSDCRSRSW